LSGRTEIVALLLDHGADINAKDEESGATPLYHAASWGRREVVELLLGRGADSRAPAADGKTPLQAAAANGHQEIVTLLRLRASAVKTK
jgi:ankyrin repeat protein